MRGERIELWLRPLSSWTVGRTGSFADDLATLEARGIVESYDVDTWSKQVPVDPDRELTPREAALRERVRTFEEWAADRGYDLPAFSRTRKVRTRDGTTYEARLLPLVALAGYDGDDLAWMAPYSDGDRHVSVPDRLDELAARPPDDHTGRSEGTWAGAD